MQHFYNFVPRPIGIGYVKLIITDHNYQSLVRLALVTYSYGWLQKKRELSEKVLPDSIKFL
jgi:hypothetical protein